MDVLWGNCSVLCKMYERGKEVILGCKGVTRIDEKTDMCGT